MRPPRMIATLIILASAIRAAALFVRYVLGIGGVLRFHVETATFIFIVCAAAWRFWTSATAPAEVSPDRHIDTSARRAPLGRVLGFAVWLLFVVVALLLYRPALSIGLLSDDFVLVERAAAWNLGAVTAALFRPLPLFLWGVILRLRGTPTALHAFNVVLHATNAWLVVWLVRDWIDDWTWSLIAGLMFLTSPLAPEAVAWSAGVFDVASTACMLTIVLVVRTYGDHPTAIRRFVTVIVAVAALMSKETAVVTPALLLLDGWVRRRLTKPVIVDAGILTFLFVAVAVARLMSAFSVISPRLDRYAFQRGVFGSFGSLAVPWHVDIVRTIPAVPVIVALAILTFATAFCLRRVSMGRCRVAAAGMAWVLVAIVPVWPILGVMPDLQGSRYLYLSTVGWAALVAAIAAPERGRGDQWRAIAMLPLIGLVAVSAWGVRQHLRPWSEAAMLRDDVERSAAFGRGCPSIVVSNLPDNIKGAYIFRNGAREAFRRDLNISVSVATVAEHTPATCSFRWNDKTSSFDH